LLQGAETIIDTHDFLTAQFQTKRKFSIGDFFEKEIGILKKFDKIFVISSDEKYLFSQFTNRKVFLATHPVANKSDKAKELKKFDVIYVASDNEHNIKSAKWFFEEVYQQLDKNISFCVIGKITNHIGDYQNVTKIFMADDLDDYYANCQVAICPMLSGTGLKIKVVEAMSFGIPVVCSERGIDGLSGKINNGCLVTDKSDEFAGYIKQLLSDSNFYSEIKKQSENYFIQNFELNRVYEEFDSLFRN